MTTALYVVAGQSNAVRVEWYTGVEEALDLRDSDATVLHVSQGGTGLAPKPNRNDWYPYADDDPQTGELYEDLVTEIDALLATGEYHLAGVFWLQDGADANVTDAPLYEERLQAFYDGLVGEFGSDFQFSIAKSSEVTPLYLDYVEEQATSDTPDPFDVYEPIFNAQIALEANNANVNVIDTTQVWIDAGLPETGPDGAYVFGDNTFEDPVHYNNAAADAMAEAFIAQFDTTTFTINDQGIEVTKHFSADTLFKISRVDAEDVKSWETATEFYRDGEKTSSVFVADTGITQLRETVPSDEFGFVVVNTFTDEPDIRDWETKTVVKTLDGEVISTDFVYDETGGGGSGCRFNFDVLCRLADRFRSNTLREEMTETFRADMSDVFGDNGAGSPVDTFVV